MLFCSGLGGVGLLPFTCAALSSCVGARTLPPDAVPGRTGSLAATEFTLLFTLAPGVGEEGLTGATAPFSVGICELLLPGGGPSEERISRVAGGRPLLDPGFGFLSFLKKKLMVGGLVVR